MLIFDKAKLLKIIKDFHELTHATISIWDSDYNQIMVYPQTHKKLCKKIKENPCGNKKCFLSDKNAFISATNMETPCIITCHAGLLDTVIPVRYNHEILAFIMFGQIRDSEEEFVKLDNVKKLCLKYDIDEKFIDEHYAEIPVLTHKQISAAANFLSMSTIYLHVSQAIKIERNELVSAIDKYITENIDKQITVDTLCNHFSISSNQLYELSHKYFHSPIANYITRKKIDLSKHYLTTTQLSVAMISEKVGFSDYSYFIRKFKKITGYTPLHYRKNFPHNIL